jgi:DNA repair protein RadC
VIREIGQTDRENLVVVMLNTELKPIGANLVPIGSLAESTIQPPGDHQSRVKHAL